MAFQEDGSFSCSHDDNYYSPHDDMAVTMLGKTRTLIGLDRNEWIFLILSTTCIFATVGLTIQNLTTLSSDSTDFVFGILLLINAGFCLLYTVHGILREREFELYCLIVAIFIVSIYVVVNFFVTVSTASVTKKVRVSFICILAPFIVGYGWVVGQGFGYLEFKTVGAGAEVQGMYRAASRLSGLLKFDFQLAVILLVLSVENVSDISYFAKCSLAIGIPLQLLANLICWIAMRTEQLALVWLFLPFCVAEPVYMGYRMYQFNDRWKHYTSDDVDKLTYSTIAATCCAIIVRVLLLLALYIVVKNFGRGLKYKVFQVPINENCPPVLPRKRDIKKCCGVVCCGPIG